LVLLPHRIAEHAAARPEAVAFRFVDRPGRGGRNLTWRELWNGAAATARLLRTQGLFQARVGVACNDATDFVSGLTACLLSGNTVVPFPVALSRRAAPRARAIADAARPDAVLLSDANDIPEWLAEAEQRSPTLVLGVADAAPGSDWAVPSLSPSNLAVVQFSSGSTGTPRGVGLSHGNVAANCAAIIEAYGVTSETHAFCWLPLHHDMGLVGHVLASMWVGCQSALMNPLRFLQRPLDWLKLVSEERAEITSAPNFAFEICTKAAAGENLEGIDLSCVTAAICGGEPVLHGTVERFLATFASVGMKPAAFAPSYGLAEATLLVATGRNAGGPRFSEVATSPGKNGAGNAAVVADLGPPVRGVDVRIVDANGDSVGDGVVGEIEISGPSVGRLIGDDGTLSEPGPLRTGDLGFLRKGHVHVVGRRKDIIIVRGQNVHPSDVEAAAFEAHPAIVPGGLAAVGLAVGGTEELVLLIEVNGRALTDQSDTRTLQRQVGERVARRVGLVPAEVITLKSGTLPRTSSGKVRRFEAAAMLAAGRFGETLDSRVLAAP
jgi:acyl-CoA synthetase (AMP-forming)/AMP-acid ligase II